jgi:hypothetical protein
MNIALHPMTHSYWFGIGIAIGIEIGFWMHRIPIAISIPIQNGADCRLVFGIVTNCIIPWYIGPSNLKLRTKTAETVAIDHRLH